MVVRDQGQVGIGTTTPSNLLDVVDGNAAESIRLSNTNISGLASFILRNNAGIQSVIGCGGSSNTSNTANRFYITHNGCNIITALSGGNVGIGITTPFTPLDVSGEVRVGNATTGTISFCQSGSVNPNRRGYISYSTNSLQIYNQENGDILFATSK
jgi:hypothetical protein